MPAYTALAWIVLERHAPDLVRGDMYPFAGRQAGEDKTDSLPNASAMHHKPDTFCNGIIATAERVASGFERKNSSGTTKPTETKALSQKQNR